MKKLGFIVVMTLLLLFACSEDDYTNPVQEQLMIEENNLQVKGQKATRTVPMKVDFEAISNLDLPLVQCLPGVYENVYIAGGGWICGIATHVGQVNMLESPYSVTSCNFGPSPGQITEIMEGRVTGANGDFFYYNGEVIISFTDGSLFGDITMNDGTGKFEGVSGVVAIEGMVDFTTGEISWTGEGSITFPMEYSAYNSKKQ